MSIEPDTGALSGAAGLIDKLVGWVGRTVAWATVGLVLLVAYNVLARYLFSVGSVALQELEWHVLALTALVGMSYGVNCGDEVRVDMLYARYGPRTKAIVDIFSAVLMLLVSIFLAYKALAYVGQSFQFNEGSPDPGGLPYRYILKSFIPIGFVLLALQSVVEITKASRRLQTALNDAGS